MTVEKTISDAETIVIKAETRFIDECLAEYDKSNGKPFKQNHIQDIVCKELGRQSDLDAFDEEEQIIGNYLQKNKNETRKKR